MIKKMLFGVLAMSILATSCSDDDDNSINLSTLTLNLTNLEDLGADSMYEGWIIVDANPVSTGKFTVDAMGVLSQTAFIVNATQLNSATAFVLSVEPTDDTDPLPSDIKILSGDFSGASANVNTDIIADLSSISGQYILRTPSTNSTADDNKGIWFLDPTTGPGATLSLPTLPSGWKYEGWAIIEGVPISSGRFDSASGADEDGNPYAYAGTENPLPPFPGEDFIQGNPNGVDLAAATHVSRVVVSIEPEPDNSPSPFLLKVLVGEALDATSATAPTLHPLQGGVLPSGSVTR